MFTNKPLVIVVEGIDGCGKSSLITGLVEKLNNDGIPTCSLPYVVRGHLREAILHDPTLTPVMRATLLRFAATEAAKQVDEKLSEGFTVIVDRGPLSYEVYQGCVEGLRGYFPAIEKLAGQALVPDWTILIDIDENLAFERLKARGNLDLIESNGGDYLNLVRNAYLGLQRKDMERIVLVDGDQSPKLLLSQAYDEVLRFFEIENENLAALV